MFNNEELWFVLCTLQTQARESITSIGWVSLLNKESRPNMIGFTDKQSDLRVEEEEAQMYSYRPSISFKY